MYVSLSLYLHLWTIEEKKSVSLQQKNEIYDRDRENRSIAQKGE